MGKDAEFHLSEADVLKLRRWGEAVDKVLRGEVLDDKDDNIQGSDVYLALLPNGENIPAADGNTPGRNDNCCFFKLSIGTAADPKVRVYTRLELPNDEPQRQTVYNIYNSALDYSQGFFRVSLHKSGAWLCEKPAASGVTTTTTTTTTASCSGVGGGLGGGIWDWNDTTKEWDPVSCDCALATTSTTTTTTTTTTGGTTTTTTTGNPCTCLKPQCCGTGPGDRAWTPCSTGTNTAPTCSTTTSTTTTGGTTTSTTTTTCDCSTTTTTGGGGFGCGTCTFVFDANGNIVTSSNSCTGGCACANPGGICGIIIAPCAPTPPTTTTGITPYCNGDCRGLCIQGTLFNYREDCIHSVGTVCVCSTIICPPTGCVEVITPCATPPPPTTTTTTGGVTTTTCDFSLCSCSCYYATTTTTTGGTTTTTTTGVCDAQCKASWDGASWSESVSCP